jgi:hypothetical protein
VKALSSSPSPAKKKKERKKLMLNFLEIPNRPYNVFYLNILRSPFYWKVRENQTHKMQFQMTKVMSLKCHVFEGVCLKSQLSCVHQTTQASLY